VDRIGVDFDFDIRNADADERLFGRLFVIRPSKDRGRHP
jgi:hypothetical protein